MAKALEYKLHILNIACIWAIYSLAQMQAVFADVFVLLLNDTEHLYPHAHPRIPLT